MLNPLKRFKAPAAAPLLGGRYQVVQQLGKGGFGQTFLAQDQHLPGQPVCVIKQLNPQMRDAPSLQTARRLFDTEAEVLYALGEHDQIPRLMAHFEAHQEFYLAQEYVEGEPLNALLAGDQPWSKGPAIALLEDILSVLAFVHQQDVIHRDIKPSNLICRRRDGRIVLIDFGAVKQVNTQFLNPKTGQTNLTISIGTHGYVPNEQIAGTPHFSSDVYAVGIIGIQVLSGLQPKHLRQDVRTSELTWREACPQIDPALAEVIDRMVRYDHRQRYATAAEAQAALAELPATLRQMVPDHGYLPFPMTPAVAAQSEAGAQSEATVSLPQPGVAPTLVAARGAPTASLPMGLRDSSSPPTLAVLGRYVSDRFLSGAKPKGATVPAVAPPTSPRPALRKHPWRVYAAIACGALLILTGLRNRPSASTSAPELPPATSAAAPASTDAVLEADPLRSQDEILPALEGYAQVMAEAPDAELTHWGRCYGLNQLQQFEAAIAACDQVLALNPEHAPALSSKGFAVQQQQRFDDALALFDQALAQQPESAEFHNN